MQSENEGLVVYFNGEFVPWNDAKIHVFSPSVKYGAAVFEGVRGYWSPQHKRMHLFRLREHMERMELSQKILRFDELVRVDPMCDAIVELIRLNKFRESVHIRPTAYIAGEGESSAGGPVGCFITAVPRETSSRVKKGCTAQISSWERINDRAMPARAKSNANYNNSRLAGIQAKVDGYEAAIMLNSRGKLSEGQGMCLFIVRDGVAATPSVTNDILESITRDSAITLLRERGVEVRERDIDRTELYAASEAFFCGTGWEITPIIGVDGLPIGDGVPGPLTQELQESYFNLVYGDAEDSRGWVTPV